MERIRLLVTLLALCAGTPAAFAQQDEDAPPRPISDVVEATLHCYPNYSRSGPLTGDVDITVTVDAGGHATSVSTPAGTPDRVAAAAQCVGVRLKYKPAVQDGQPVPARCTHSPT